jgi:hypothetical protein
MDCQRSTITIFGSNTELFVPNCQGNDAWSRPKPISGVPVRKRWAEIVTAVVSSVSLEPGDWRSTPNGSAPQRYVVAIPNIGNKIEIDTTRSLFAKIAKGLAWREIEGAIEDIKYIGSFLKLTINPANLSGRGECL